MTAISPEAMALIAAITAAYWGMRPAWRMPMLALATLALLLWLAPTAAAALAVIAASSWAVVRSRVSMAWRAAYGIGLLLGLVAARALADSPWLLLGAAFYVLKVIHVVIDSGLAPPMRLDWRGYAAYLLYPPSFAVGPIQRLPEFEREATRARWNAALFSTGLERLLIGYFFVVVLVDALVDRRLHEAIAALPPSTLRSWLDCLQYGANLYLTFAGYSHIAIGFANLLGMRVPENFESPFLAVHIGDFWRRWHITLGQWCRDYVNTPVMALTRRRSVAIVASMLVLGLWHETSMRYLLWGAFHGAGIVLWRQWQGLRARWPPSQGAAQALETLAVRALTLLFVTASFAITKEPDMAHGLGVLAALIGLG